MTFNGSLLWCYERGCIKYNNIQFIFNKYHHFVVLWKPQKKIKYSVDINKKYFQSNRTSKVNGKQNDFQILKLWLCGLSVKQKVERESCWKG